MAGIRPESFIRMLARPASAVVPGLAARVLARMFITPVQRAVRPEEARVLETARRSALPTADGRPIPIYSWGQGPTVLLVHGWSSRAAQLTPFVEPLLARGLQVISFDQLGHGLAKGGTAALPQFADTLQTVVDELGPIHGIVAHSLGGAATTIALSRGLRTERLVYVAPPENLVAYLIRLATHLGFSQAVAQQAEEALERRYDGRFEEARGRSLGPEIHLPLLVVHDRGDREVPLQEGQAIVDSWGGDARLMTTQGLGHNRLLTASEVLSAASEFLTVAAEPPISG